MAKAFYIGPYQTGLINAVKPFLIPEEAFAKLENAYVWRGRIRKRVGSSLFTSSTVTPQYQQLISRLRHALTGGAGVGITDGAGVATGRIPGVTFLPGQQFSIGNVLYTVTSNAAGWQPMLRTDGTPTADFDVTAVAPAVNYRFAGAPATTQIYWYPSQPVMGIVTYEAAAINDEPVIAFDTQFAYRRAAGAWALMPGAAWTGTNSQFFWITNYRGPTSDNYYMFVVNNNRADRLKYYDGANWNTFAATLPRTRLNNTPAFGLAANFYLDSARLIVSFKDRLIALNTLESVDLGAGRVDAVYTNRARWSQNGSPIAAAAWYEDVAGKGGWADAPTREAIITARILKDRLIVYFERSTWELVYTGNFLTPFIWQTIDAQLGAESTFSSVLVDDYVYGIGQNGIHQCDGLHVRRIDEKIPQEVFKIHNGNAGIERVAGIRDFFNEMIYWTFPAEQNNPTFPTRLLVYNYRQPSWAFFDDSITAFGYHQTVDDLTWGACTYTWEEFTRTWVSGLNQSLTKWVLAGNQQGFTFNMDPNKNTNAMALQITNIDITALPVISITSYSHNLKQGDYIYINYVQGTTNINQWVYRVANITSADIFTIVTDGVPAGAYTGGGLIERVSMIDILTKQFNFYPDHRRIAIDKVDFDIERSVYGEIYINFYSSTSTTPMAPLAIANQVALGDYTLETSAYALYPQELSQSRLVRPVYIQAEGDCIQVQISWRDDQIRDYNLVSSLLEINSMTFHVSPTGPRL